MVVFKEIFLGILGAVCKGKDGTSARPESQFRRSSPRCAPRAIPSTYLLTYFEGDS